MYLYTFVFSTDVPRSVSCSYPKILSLGCSFFATALLSPSPFFCSSSLSVLFLDSLSLSTLCVFRSLSIVLCVSWPISLDLSLQLSVSGFLFLLLSTSPSTCLPFLSLFPYPLSLPLSLSLPYSTASFLSPPHLSSNSFLPLYKHLFFCVPSYSPCFLPFRFFFSSLSLVSPSALPYVAIIPLITSLPFPGLSNRPPAISFTGEREEKDRHQKGIEREGGKE